MANLEAELARFEAELAAVETGPVYEQPASDAHQQYYHNQIVAGPSDGAAAPHPQAPPAAPSSMSHAQHQTQPMYHQYQPPTQQAAHGSVAPPMYPPPPAYGMAQQQQQPAYGMPPPPPLQQQQQAAQGYYPPQQAYSQEAYAVAPTMMGSTLSAAPIINAPPPQSEQDGEAWKNPADASKANEVKKAGKKVKRYAAGQTWWDPTLSEWPENDFRIFVGDLGNEVNDDILAKAFQKYPSFAKAKVVRDNRSNKSKGFGFVSFLESGDYAKAFREMDGQYIGNRPCKLRKSTWQERLATPSRKHKKQKT